ncbi:hypothetical protein C1T17_03175 [Sphingobium sp. SCG-1]|uniref:hypothetical protein n=1 Tax=Sphingobium sp. SCG-1 TaxID=2072936 RepID=UPI000CD6AC1F|nr:hypothetical protein [Sphingobium sp. SCG-1]AUW57238.1 hypothetical protein C1T17_03175 [Sphingobium sp. SCG-1]
MAKRIFLASVLALGLSACASVPAAAPVSTLPPPSGPMASAYGKGHLLIGADAKKLIQMFGRPRLDIRDPSVRKLQFANGRCVLDTYLYASAKGKEPVVTYADSRTPAGKDVDPAACATMLTAK